MYKITDKRENKFGVLDTTDGIVEYYTLDDLIFMEKTYNLTIEGLSKLKSQRRSIESFIRFINESLINSLEEQLWVNYDGSTNHIILMVKLDKDNKVVDIFRGSLGKSFTFEIDIHRLGYRIESTNDIVRTNIIIKGGNLANLHIVYGKTDNNVTVDITGTVFCDIIINNLGKIKEVLSNWGNSVKLEMSSKLSLNESFNKSIVSSINKFLSSIEYLVDLYNKILCRYFDDIDSACRSVVIGNNEVTIQGYTKYGNPEFRIYLSNGVYVSIYGLGSTSVSICDDYSELYLLDHNMKPSRKPFYFDERGYSESCGDGIHTYCGILSYGDYYYSNRGSRLVLEPSDIFTLLDKLVLWLNTYKSDIVSILRSL